jgi:hypothetical protein
MVVPLREGRHAAVEPAVRVDAVVVSVVLQRAGGIKAAPSLRGAPQLVEALADVGRRSDVHVVDVHRWVVDHGSVRPDGRNHLLHDVYALRMLCQCVFQIPDVVPADLEPVVSPGSHNGSNSVPRGGDVNQQVQNLHIEFYLVTVHWLPSSLSSLHSDDRNDLGFLELKSVFFALPHDEPELYRCLFSGIQSTA